MKSSLSLLRLTLFVALAALVFVSCSLRNSSSDSAVPGMIEFRSTTIDKGEMPCGSVAKYEFKYKNVGKGPVQILAVSHMCGCTETEFSKDILKPGRSATLTVTFVSRKMPAGPFSKQVMVITSNEKRSHITLTVAGTLVE